VSAARTPYGADGACVFRPCASLSATELQDLLPGIINQLGPDNLNDLKKIYSQYTSSDPTAEVPGDDGAHSARVGIEALCPGPFGVEVRWLTLAASRRCPGARGHFRRRRRQACRRHHFVLVELMLIWVKPQLRMSALILWCGSASKGCLPGGGAMAARSTCLHSFSHLYVH
jgi:hypothetical protein